MRRPMIVGNWKMNTTFSDAMILATSILEAAHHIEGVEIILCPPFTWLVPIKELFERAPKNLELGAQNMWYADMGAMTGEISPLMLKDITKFVILGHSERRTHFHESDDLINDKVHAALKNGLIPIIAVGEKEKDHIEGEFSLENAKPDILTQLDGALSGVTAEMAEKIVIAYEPVWAIGTGNPATGEYANEVALILRNHLAKKFSEELAMEIKILYGGSVDPANINEFISQEEIDGALVGGASLKGREFITICRIAAGTEMEA